MLSPIDQLIEAAGKAATVTVYALVGYDPTSLTSYAPGAGTPTGIRVVPSVLETEMLERGITAHFLAGTQTPAGIIPGSSKLTLTGGSTYTIVKKRERIHVGGLSGWSLECAV